MRYFKNLFSAAVFLVAIVPINDAVATSTILVLGDSISEGYGIRKDEGWVALLAKKRADQGHTETWVNASIGGETTQGGARRLPKLLQEHHPSIVIIELGGNDGLRGWPITESRTNIRDMIALVQSSGAKAIVVAMQMPPNMGSRYNSMFRQIFTDECQQPCVLVPEFIELVALDPKLMQSDGIHPTAEAQPALAAAVAKYLLHP